MSPFKQKVIEIVRLIPSGKVASYGQVALYAGAPRTSREVGWILSKANEDMPWWRVVNKKGYLSIRGNTEYDKHIQKKLLETEGIEVSAGFEIDMATYRWIITPQEAEKLHIFDVLLADKMRQKRL